MKKKNKGLLILVLLLLVTIGIGYAIVSTDKVTINGHATATTDFDIQFKTDTTIETATGTATTGGKTNSTGDKKTTVTASYTSEDVAEFKVSNLKYVGEYGEATYTIINKSTDLKANITAEVTSAISDTEHYSVTTTMATGASSVAPDGTTTVTVRVALIKAFDDQTEAANEATFTVTAKGEAVQE